MNNDPHSIFLDFLNSELTPLNEQQAQALFQHLSDCEDCAKALADHQAHAEALMEAIHPPPKLTIAAQEEVSRDQAELLVFGDAVLNRLTLPPAAKAAMEAPLSTEAKNELWTLTARETPRLRAALACSEGALALGAFLSIGRRKRTSAHLTRQRLLVNDKRVVPDQYFALRIADYASMPEDLALVFWHSFVDVMIEGKIGCLGLFASPKSAEEISLSLVDDGPT